MCRRPSVKWLDDCGFGFPEAFSICQHLIGTFADFVATNMLTVGHKYAFHLTAIQFPFIWISVPFLNGLKWYIIERKWMHVKSLLADEAGWKTNHCRLFEEVVNRIIVTERTTNAAGVGSCHWLMSIMVRWICLDARGQFVCITLQLFCGTYSFSYYARLSVRSPFAIHHSSPVETNYSMYSIFPLCSRDIIPSVS